MALERLTLSPVIIVGGDEDQLNKPPRLPRWTRQELLVLIQGKRVAENRVRRGRMVSSSSSSSTGVAVEPKWSSVSSYCKRHGVNRGPVQCRKRWSNLAGDYKKIKEWESSSSSESFWVMRNDLRRERKLPGFFDREVYDILDDAIANNAHPPPAAAGGDKSLILSLAPSSSSQPKPETEDVVFDSGRTNNGLFSDDDQLPSPMPTTPTPSLEKDAPPTPISATQYYEPPLSQAQAQTQTQGVPPPHSTEEDKETSNPSPETNQGRKRKHTNEEDENMSLQNHLIEAMERNCRLLTSQLEIQNTNSQLDREQRKDHANALFAVLNKLADAMVKIADKL